METLFFSKSLRVVLIWRVSLVFCENEFFLDKSTSLPEYPWVFLKGQKKQPDRDGLDNNLTETSGFPASESTGLPLTFSIDPGSSDPGVLRDDGE